MYFITLVDKESIHKTKNLQQTLGNYNLCIIDTYDKSLGNLSKIFKTYEYIKSNPNFLDNDILCIMDGHDVLFNNEYTDKHLTDAFKNTGKNMIISGEINFTHHCPSTKPFFENICKNKYKYLNSGVIICYKWAYLQMFSDIINNFEKYTLKNKYSDQRIIGLYIKDKWESNTLPISLMIDDSAQFITTITIHWNEPLDSIKSPLIHVTFLKDNRQYNIYTRLLQKFIDKFIDKRS